MRHTVFVIMCVTMQSTRIWRMLQSAFLLVCFIVSAQSDEVAEQEHQSSASKHYSTYNYWGSLNSLAALTLEMESVTSM